MDTKTIQILFIIFYFALTVTVGVLAGRRSKGSDSFHGAAMGLFAIVAAASGEWLGGTATTGVSEYGFTDGMYGAWYTISNGLGTMVLALGFAKLYRSLGSVTVPGIIEKFFGVKARTVSSVWLTIVMLAVGLSQMVAAGKLGQTLIFDNNPSAFIPCVLVFAVIFIVYTLAGGMNAVESTNKVHLFAMYGGAIVALIFALMRLSSLGIEGGLAGGIKAVEESIAAGTSKVTNSTDPVSFWSMLPKPRIPTISSWIIASLLGACTAQAGIQPVLAAKDVPTAKTACIITALVVAPFGILTALLGMSARVLSENGLLLVGGANVVNGKEALPALMQNLSDNSTINGVIGGIVLASILAAILSTVSPIILASGTMITKDIYQRVMNPGATDKQILLISRVTTALSGVICALAAIALVNLQAVLDIVYAAYSLRGALFIVILLGIYWKRASQPGACISMCLTAVVAIFWKVFQIATTVSDEAGKVVTKGHYPLTIGNFAITETYAAVAVALVATIVFSLVFPKRGDDIYKRA
ncbi:MAG: sodium:solute symporter family protein [Oscillospiraceae bacterium]|jgi:SSS family solute:Na+ symporter|nr:sodium:solute symporter family protein [Oscillospiraceae bacterium]